jgi:hypothetical protein
MKHRLGLLFIVVSIALIIVGVLLGIKDAAVYIIDKIVAVASIPSPPQPKVTNVYINNPPSNNNSKSKKRSRKATEDIEPQTINTTPVITNVRPALQPEPVREVVWRRAETSNLSSNRFEIVLPVHLREFDSKIWANANQNIMVTYDSSSNRGRLRYEVAGGKLPIGEKKEANKNSNWSDSIKIINEEPIQDAFAKPYILIVTMEEAKPKYTHNDCVKLVYETGGNLNQVPSDCMPEWERYQAEEKRRQEHEIADAQRQEERRRQEAERDRSRKQQERDRMLQQGVSTIERMIKRH